MYLLYIQLFNTRDGTEKTFMGSYSGRDEEKLLVFEVSQEIKQKESKHAGRSHSKI